MKEEDKNITRINWDFTDGESFTFSSFNGEEYGNLGITEGN